MSPLMIKMLLHYYACARDYRDEVPGQHAASSAVKDAIEFFRGHNLIVELFSDEQWRAQDAMDRPSQFTVSDRGRAMVDAYMAVRLPVVQWVQP
jgi:hypothetical protein